MATEEAPQDQRKRALEEALERRFAVARAEATQLQERRSNNRKFDRGSGREGDGGTGITSTVSSSVPSQNKGPLLDCPYECQLQILIIECEP